MLVITWTRSNQSDLEPVQLLPLQNESMPSSRYTLLTTSHAVVCNGLQSLLDDLLIENWSCINSFTRSIGATAVLATAPAHAPAIQSLNVFFGFLFELSVDGSGLGDGASIITRLRHTMEEDDKINAVVILLWDNGKSNCLRVKLLSGQMYFMHRYI